MKTQAENFLEDIIFFHNNENNSVELQFKDGSTVAIDIDSLRFRLFTAPMRLNNTMSCGTIGNGVKYD